MHEFIPCFNTSTIRPAPLMEKIRLAGEAGFRAIELWNDDVTAYVEGRGRMEEIRRALNAAGLSVPSVIAVLKGGTMKIVKENGQAQPQVWETGKAYWQPASPPDELHGLVNEGSEPIEVMTIELKKER